MKSLILIGFMGSGKTTVGRALAEKLQMPLVDLDTVVVQEQKMEISEIFAQFGEERFRQIEHEVLCRYAGMKDLVISPGGGAVLRAENRAVMRENCYVISLTARPDVILERVNREQTVRPVLEQREPGQTKLQRIMQVMEQRMPAYREADLILDTSDASVDELVDEILTWLAQQAGVENMNIMKTIEVELGNRSYAIEIGTGLLERCGEKVAALVKGRQAAVITDSNVGPLYAETVQQSLEKQGFDVTVVTIPAGEQSKSWEQAEKILTILLEKKFHRDACVIALGGGVVGDLSGFVASIYQRGIAFFQIPTSLLAQVDSSVGGKVAVNHALGKNMIGAFYQPRLVLIDMLTLRTLEQRHWQNGLAEVVKYGVIYDAAFYDYLKQYAEKILQRELDSCAEMIATCCRLKAEVVALDEKEGGVRAHLNYGHTIGHGLELAGHYKGYLHGEAVAVGMVLAARYAAEQGMCDVSVEEELIHLLQRFQLPVTVEKTLPQQDILDGMLLDKKVQDGQLVFILPEKIGRVKIVKGIPQEDIAMLLQKEFDQ